MSVVTENTTSTQTASIQTASKTAAEQAAAQETDTTFTVAFSFVTVASMLAIIVGLATSVPALAIIGGVTSVGAAFTAVYSGVNLASKN